MVLDLFVLGFFGDLALGRCGLGLALAGRSGKWLLLGLVDLLPDVVVDLESSLVSGD